MATMRNAQSAVVPIEKISGYLLSRTHPVGARKAAFFRQFGFSEDKPEQLRTALQAHAMLEIVCEIDTDFGVKFEVTGPLATPAGGSPIVKSVWITSADGIPRLVTVVPGSRGVK